MLTDDDLRGLGEQLVLVPGVEGVMLGGSRARGDAYADSDVDLGLYYRRPLDVDGLRELARAVAMSRPDLDPVPALTEPGGWGPWVDGGGWLTIAGVPVDWIYRDLDRVRRSAELARAGEFVFHFQIGHPLGVPDFAYAGEVALGVVLADPRGELTELKRSLEVYPSRLADTIVDRLGEADFVLGALVKSAARGDTTLVAGCLFRVVALCAHAVHARAGSWVISEKGVVDAAGRLPNAPAGFAARAHGLLGRLGTEPDQLSAALDAAAALLDDVRSGRG